LNVAFTETFAGGTKTGVDASRTVTQKLQFDPSGVEQVTGVVPRGKNESDGGVQVTGPHPSSVVGVAYVTVLPQEGGCGVTSTVMLFGLEMAHGNECSISDTKTADESVWGTGYGLDAG
jgi:hypothetical protein